MPSSATGSETLARLTANAMTLRDWLFTRALPLWWHIGADRISGGFYEKLNPNGDPVEEPRRARVVARQLFVFSTAARMGWDGPVEDAIQHALASLTNQHLDSRGDLISLRRHDGAVLSDTFDLYDYAFALFGLAAAGSHVPTVSVEALAGDLLDGMARWKHPIAGFEDAMPRKLPLKANPHMHLLEACLAWEAVSAHPRWSQLADEIAELGLLRLIDPATGALHECFDGDWKRLSDPATDIIEPGHQFEWAWLLLRWSHSRHRLDARASARQLATIGEGRGVDRGRGLAINGLSVDLKPLHTVSRLWPQTERVKAWALTAALSESQAEHDMALRHADEAVAGLLRYLDHPVPGSWWENISPDGLPLREPARTSSLYHIVCAISELDQALATIANG